MTSLRHTAEALYHDPRLQWAGALGWLVLLYGFVIWFVDQPAFDSEPVWLSLGLLTDMVLTTAAVIWVLLIRTGRLPALVLGPVLVASLVAAHALLPLDQTPVVATALTVAVVAVEGLVASVVLLNLGRLRRGYRQRRQEGLGWEEACEAALDEVLGRERLVQAVMTELRALAYGLFWWRIEPPEPGPDAAHFTIHRDNGWVQVAAVLCVLSVPEGALLHWLLSGWSEAAAWASTGLHVYGVLWLWGDAQAMRLRPLVVEPQRLILRCGIRWRAEIDRDLVVAVRRVSDWDADDEEQLSLAAMGEPELVVELSAPIEVRGPFGIRRTPRRLGVTVDEREAFVGALSGAAEAQQG